MADTRRTQPANVASRFDLANRLFFRLYQSSNLMHKVGTRAVSSFGSTTQQWAVLGALARPRVGRTGMSVKELIGFLLLTRQNLSIVLDRLETRGWIERAQDLQDRRSRRIRLTEAGEAEWARMLVEIGSFYDSSLADFTAEELLLLYRLLDRLKDGLETMSREENGREEEPA
ncbi:MAG: transcriptional regulator [Enterovirga sp.]|nr:transcriptional regulator [Enterovirga sp.]